VYRPLQFHKRSQLFFSPHDETLSVIAMCVCNPLPDRGETSFSSQRGIFHA